jgi:hypothetical protein
MRYASRIATGRSCWAPACDEAAGQRTRAEFRAPTGWWYSVDQRVAGASAGSLRV